MSRTRRGFGVAAVVAAGALAGAAMEELLYRRVFRKPDLESRERVESLPSERVEVVSFDGTPINVRAYGPSDASRTIVLGHGAIESLALWHYQVRDLLAAGGYRLVAYDARGHGASGPARGPDGTTPFTGYALARDLVAVVTQATSGRVVLAGHSMGGMAIQALWQYGEIVHIADRVAGAVLVNSTYTADLRGWRGGGTRGERALERIEGVLQRLPVAPKLIERVRPGTNDLTLLIGRFAFGSDPSPKHVALSVKMYERTPSDTIASFIDLARFDAHEGLASIDVPVLVIAGSRDLITPLWLSEEIAARVPGAELAVFEGCGHLAPFERPEELTSYLAKFAERVLP